MCRKNFVILLLFMAFALLTACSYFGVNESNLPITEINCEIDDTVPGYTPDIAPTFGQNESPSLPQIDEPPVPKAYELCDCGNFYAHYIYELQTLKSSPPLNIRDVGPFGFGTHFTYQFDTVHTATYLQWETDWPSNIAIWPDEPLYDFSFVSVHHNAICCAYIGEALLAIDKLYPSDVVLLTVAFMHYLYPRGGIIFTDVDGSQHYMFLSESMIGGCAPGFFLSPTNNLIDLHANWLDLEIISIPKAFTYDKGGLHNDIFILTGCPIVPSEGIWGATFMWAGYLKVESIESMVESSLTAEYFLFDDGHVGYMLDFADEIWWVREDWMAVSFRHGGYRPLFEIHENLILTIARSLTSRYIVTPSIYTVEQIQTALQFQFEVEGLCENMQVVSVQRVERYRDYIWHEPAGEYFCLLNTARYRVVRRFAHDGEYTILTSYYYFFDESGTPVLAFIMC